MPIYLAEFFLSRARGVEAAALAEQVERRAPRPVRFVRAVSVPAQEFCLCLFEAADGRDITDAAAAAGFALATRPEQVELFEALRRLDDRAGAEANRPSGEETP